MAGAFLAGAAFFAAFFAGAAFFVAFLAALFAGAFAAGAVAWSAGVRRIALRAAVTADEASDFRVLRAISWSLLVPDRTPGDHQRVGGRVARTQGRFKQGARSWTDRNPPARDRHGPGSP